MELLIMQSSPDFCHFLFSAPCSNSPSMLCSQNTSCYYYYYY